MEEVPPVVKLMPVYEYAEFYVLRGGFLSRFEIGHPSWVISVDVLIELLEVAEKGARRRPDYHIRFAGMQQFPRLATVRL